jgi:putative transposase
MPRLRRIEDTGLIQHVMNRANRRVAMFLQPSDYEAFILLLIEAGRRFGVSLFAFCLMPNHWHLVVMARDVGAVTAYMRWLTGTHVKRYHRLYELEGTGHLYQGRYTSVPVQGDVHFLVVLRYVEANPLRAGLVARAEDWRWSSLGAPRAVREQLLVDGPIPRPSNWVEWVNQREAELTEIRRCVVLGKPYGSTDWMSATASKYGLEFTMRSRGRRRMRAAQGMGGPGDAGAGDLVRAELAVVSEHEAPSVTAGVIV